ncbi:inosine monophosphate dehydrogenase [Paraphaeosphaeria sporulosa]|uniref:Inosine monophosphate dehydrogenase n=1 Tax=Paraphaeosphaeria sporulosa TaxID=1460663 RepID=A0A177BWU8_9PLEO|nr:inosine monophosphate dehydrogenase [Paraphaeosphaeria sporulosa]OAF99430.1 inosine monophosphate dehydrogenase [Paraphaeosphaeria sporulosa]
MSKTLRCARRQAWATQRLLPGKSHHQPHNAALHASKVQKNTLRSFFPWTRTPFVVSAPMLGASTSRLAINVSRAGGLGFIAGGTDPASLNNMLEESKQHSFETFDYPYADLLEKKRGVLPIGVGFQLFNSNLRLLAPVIAAHKPAVVWLFAPKVEEDLREWATQIRDVTARSTRICVQVGSVAEAERSVALAEPDFLILQGADAGGHGRRQSASVISLVPEVKDRLAAIKKADIPVLAAGGIADARGVAAALALGADGAVMGTRFLASEEAAVPEGWKRELIKTGDGGVTTMRSTLCDRLKENREWPTWYDGRAIRNKGHDDKEGGMADEENVRLYKEELKRGDSAWGAQGRMVTYSGTGVGLVRSVEPVQSIMEKTLRECRHILDTSYQQAVESS